MFDLFFNIISICAGTFTIIYCKSYLSKLSNPKIKMLSSKLMVLGFLLVICFSVKLCSKIISEKNNIEWIIKENKYYTTVSSNEIIMLSRHQDEISNIDDFLKTVVNNFEKDGYKSLQSICQDKDKRNMTKYAVSFVKKFEFNDCDLLLLNIYTEKSSIVQNLFVIRVDEAGNIRIEDSYLHGEKNNTHSVETRN